MRIGIDVGGTNTDAVLMDGRRTVAWTKAPTSRDVTAGITQALKTLLAESQVAVGQVKAVMLGTTHFTNAVVERRSLSPTAVIRVGLPATGALPPFTDWPEDLRAAMRGVGYLVRGGFEFDGRTLAAIDEHEVREAAARVRDAGIESIAVSSVFSPVNPKHEVEVGAIVRDVIPRARVTLSHTIGRMGLLERENAAAMNACLSELALDIVRSFRAALAAAGIRAPFYVTQNDGTLISAEQVEAYPVLTFASGPTNSMRGAALLSEVLDGVVVDIGGTTSDVGVLVRGFPREAGAAVRIGGVRTNFRMPDVLSFGLGGGSFVRPEPLEVGPQSVGYEITQRALVFGGSDLTATDVAVAGGLASVGDPRKVSHLDGGLVEAALSRMLQMVETAVDRMKTAGGDVPLVLVGGGILLLGDRLKGVSRVIRPDFAPVANAIGAARAQVGGEVDRVFSLEGRPREDVLAEAKEQASQRVVAGGAVPSSVTVVDVEEIPLSYLPGQATRIRIKAVGDLPVD